MAKKFLTETDELNELFAIKTLTEYLSEKMNRTITWDAPADNDGFRPIDFTISTGHGVEIKTHKCESTKYNQIMISVSKIGKLNHYNKGNNLLMIMYNDCILVSKIKDLRGNMSYGGREPREGSAHDQELCLYLDKSSFKKIYTFES